MVILGKFESNNLVILDIEVFLEEFLLFFVV